MKPRPYVIMSTAVSLDGFIDDISDNRLVLSNKKDIEEVKKLRETCDAILVGANTIRKDNPKLVLPSGKKLIKVTLSVSGNIDTDSQFFTTGNSEKIIYTINVQKDKLTKKFLSLSTVVSLGEKSIDLGLVLEDLSTRGVKRLLVEGGTAIITQFLQKGFVDELRVAIAPFFVGQKNAPRFVTDGTFPANAASLQLTAVEKLDDLAVLHYINEKTDKKWLLETIALSKKCMPISSAFCVGAIITGKNGEVISTGYSRETDPQKHAEEIAIGKALKKKHSLKEATLYTSLEPCGERLSGKKTCVEWIIETGIKRVVFDAYEPPMFVKAQGESLLKKAGIETVFIETGNQSDIQ